MRRCLNSMLNAPTGTCRVILGWTPDPLGHVDCMAFDILSPSEQVAAHLRQLIQQGQWGAQLPGTPALSRETGIDRKTITGAIQILEQQGWLISQGAGRPRRIVRTGAAQPTGLRITILNYEERVRHQLYAHQLVSQLQAAGHTVSYSKRSLVEMGMQLDKVIEYVQDNPADVWIPTSASRDILEWFARQPFPSIALFGRRRGVNIAGVGPDKIETLCSLTEQLIGWGHRRIVLFSREERHVHTLGLQERRFAETLEAHGIHTGSYSLPRWQSTAAGFNACLDSYFQVTPPTALIIEESQFFVAALLELSRRAGADLPVLHRRRPGIRNVRSLRELYLLALRAGGEPHCEMGAACQPGQDQPQTGAHAGQDRRGRHNRAGVSGSRRAEAGCRSQMESN